MSTLDPYFPPESCIYAWAPTYVKNVEGKDYVTLEPGTIYPNPDTAGGVVIQVDGEDKLLTDMPRPQLQIPDDPDTNQIVYLKCSDVTEILQDGFVGSIKIDKVTVEVGETIPASTIGTTSQINIELFRWRNKELASQVTRYNIGLYGRGISGSAVFSVTYSGAIA
jgi:hypothetical protein